MCFINQDQRNIMGGSMSKYILIVVWVLMMCFFGPMLRYRKEIIYNRYQYRVTPLVAFVSFLPVIIMSGLREVTFGDTGGYVQLFSRVPRSMSGIINYLPSVSKDKGFTILTGLIKILVGNNQVIYLMILALIQGLCLIYVYRKFSENYFLSVFLFVVSTDYISWMQNGIRQFTAVTLIFLATELLLEKKYFLMTAVILIASTIHASALLMIPIMFIIQGKAWNPKTILFLIGALLAIVYVDQFTNILDTLLLDTQYTNVVSDWQSWNDDGTNPIRV